MTFENQYGDLKELETAMNRVKGLMRGINARRQRVRILNDEAALSSLTVSGLSGS